MSRNGFDVLDKAETMFPEFGKSKKRRHPLVHGGFDAVDCRSWNQTQCVNVMLTLRGPLFHAHMGELGPKSLDSGLLRHIAAFLRMGIDVPPGGQVYVVQDLCGGLFFLKDCSSYLFPLAKKYQTDAQAKWIDSGHVNI